MIWFWRLLMVAHAVLYFYLWHYFHLFTIKGVLSVIIFIPLVYLCISWIEVRDTLTNKFYDFYENLFHPNSKQKAYSEVLESDNDDVPLKKRRFDKKKGVGHKRHPKTEAKSVAKKQQTDNIGEGFVGKRPHIEKLKKIVGNSLNLGFLLLITFFVFALHEDPFPPMIMAFLTVFVPTIILLIYVMHIDKKDD